jgi:hypothetical protein
MSAPPSAVPGVDIPAGRDGGRTGARRLGLNSARGRFRRREFVERPQKGLVRGQIGFYDAGFFDQAIGFLTPRT